MVLPGLARSGGDGGGREDVVHAAGAVTFGIQGHIKEAERLDGGGDGLEGGKRERAGEVFGGNFDACKVSVVTHANLAEAEGVEGGFGLFDLGEIFAGDGAAILDP
jgi:hypothetical protein